MTKPHNKESTVLEPIRKTTATEIQNQLEKIMRKGTVKNKHHNLE